MKEKKPVFDLEEWMNNVENMMYEDTLNEYMLKLLEELKRCKRWSWKYKRTMRKLVRYNEK